MKTLDDVKRAATLADRRSRLMTELAGARVRRLQSPGAAGQRVSETEAFGVSLDHDLLGKLRLVVIAELEARLQAVETELRELGVTLPGDPVPGVEQSFTVTIRVDEEAVVAGYTSAEDMERAKAASGPGGAFVVPQSWDPATGEFTVFLPCEPTKSWFPEGETSWRSVDEELVPGGLVNRGPWSVPVLDCTGETDELVGRVFNAVRHPRNVALDIRLCRPFNALPAALGAGDIADVSIGYKVLDKAVTERSGERPLVTVHEWRIDCVRIRRTVAQAEAA